MKTPRPTPNWDLRLATAAMRKGRMLVLCHERGGGLGFYVEKGGRVTDEIAQRLMARPDVIAIDGSKPQAWRMRMSQETQSEANHGT